MHETNPAEVARERRTIVSPHRPWPFCHKVCVVMGLVIAAQIAALVLQGAALVDRGERDDDTDPAPSPSPSSTWSPECTAEDLDDGACYTWDDIRNQPTYSQGPNGPVLVK